MNRYVSYLLKKLNLFTQQTVFISCIWFIIPLAAALHKAVWLKQINNYLIYKGVYTHTIQQVNLFNLYPNEYFDKNHYGIVFSLLIMPFCFLPDWLGILLYQAIQLAGLLWVIRKLPLSLKKQNALLLYLLFEVIANCQNMQTNTFIAFVMVAAYVWIYNKKEAYAAMIIALGFLVKLYGIVGMGLFFFIKRKPRFIFYSIVSLIALYFLPLLVTSATFNTQSYIDWFNELADKNGTNSDLLNVHQNISALGFISRITQNSNFNYLTVILPAFLFQLAPLLRWKNYNQTIFQMKYLASLMLFIILFNTATETSTHIIGATGLGIWWLTSANFSSNKMLLFMLFVFVLGTLSTTDLFPKYFNYEIVRKYALKAVPYLIVWCICIYQLCFCKFTQQNESYA